MNSGPAFFIAARSLFGRRKKSFSKELQSPGTFRKKRKLLASTGGMAGAILGIGVSIVPLVLVLIVSDGMIQGITRRYMETKTYHIQVALPDRMRPEKIQEGLASVKSVEGVRAAFLERDGSAVAVSATASHAVLLRSVDEEFFLDPGARQYLKLVQGEVVPKGSRGIVLGSSLASSLKLGVGDSLTLITPSESAGASGGETSNFPGYSPRLSFFKVTGIVSAGYRDLDALWAFISPDAGERILTYSSVYSFLGIKVADPYSNGIGRNKEGIVKSLNLIYPDWFDSYLVRTWPEIEKSLYKSFGTTKTLLLFIMGLALIVAAVNLGSALSTFVAEHSMDIAILRSMGAEDSLIRNVFVGAGFITGALGTFFGLFAGLAVSWNINAVIGLIERLANILDSVAAFFMGRPAIPLKLLDPEYYLETIPVMVNYRQILIIAVLSMALSVIVSLLPARKASGVSVQELIRKS